MCRGHVHALTSNNDCSLRYHYPGAASPERAKQLPIPLFASEEYSAVNDLHGGGCWARVSHTRSA